MDKSSEQRAKPHGYKSLIGCLVVCAGLLLFGCSSSSNPGPLAGSWQWIDQGSDVITFRDGETDWGGHETVSYKVSGQDVVMTYESSLLKGVQLHFHVEGDVATMGQMKFKKIKESP